MSTSEKRAFLSPLAKLNLLAVAGLVLLDIVWAKLAGFSLDTFSLLTPISVMVILLGLAWIYTAYRPDPNIAALFIWVAIIFGLFAAGLVLSYLSTSLAFPLLDAEFLAIDKAFGFDWIAYAKFVTSYPYLLMILDFFYALTLPMLAAVIIYLGLSGEHQRLELFMTALFSTAVMTSLLCGPFPAVTTFAYLKLSAADFNGFTPPVLIKGLSGYFISDVEALRDGSLRHISLAKSTGIITFPSFHAVLTFLPVLALKGTGWIYRTAVVICVITLFSVPIIGAHYLVDIFAGLAIAWVSWIAALKLHDYAYKSAAFASDSKQVPVIA